MRRRQNGFSLIELLIVVAIILVIAAIAIPNYLRSRMVANEASAAESLRTINTALVAYSSTYPNVGFAPSLPTLGGAAPCTASSTGACLLDQVLSAGTKAGYSFLFASDGNTPSVSYTVSATPVAPGISGQRMYCTDATNVIRFEASGAGCTNSSPPIQ
ncbi:MAG TPA: prepilin-type N-terminal cleavage/methylation domain-containing protein [Candidatus Acidoferrum sp.]